MENAKFEKEVQYGGNAVAIGNLTTASGNDSTAIGAGASATGTASTAIGADSHCAADNTIQLGNTETSSLKCRVGVTIRSDIRDKTDIEPIGDGAVDFLGKVETIRYRDNSRDMYFPDWGNMTEQDRENMMKFGFCSYDKEAWAAGTKKGDRIRVGVSAQAVQAAMEEVYGDVSYGNIVDDNLHDYAPEDIPEGVENQLAVNYSNFIPFLIKGVQELNKKIEELKTLKADIAYLAEKVGINLEER